MDEQKEKMMKVTIEETITQTFMVPLAFESEVEKMYRDGKLVLDNAEKQDAQYMIEYEDGECTGWSIIN